jgi:hypothetical protein
VRVLLDENLPLEFAAACDVFVTMDKNLEHQQHVAALPFGVIVLSAYTNGLVDLRPVVKALLSAIHVAKPGVL